MIRSELKKTSNIYKKKFIIRYFILDIFNLSSLILTKFWKRLILLDFLRKTSIFGQDQDKTVKKLDNWNILVEKNN